VCSALEKQSVPRSKVFFGAKCASADGRLLSGVQWLALALFLSAGSTELKGSKGSFISPVFGLDRSKKPSSLNDLLLLMPPPLFF
jgi:hypothetical protein